MSDTLLTQDIAQAAAMLRDGRLVAFPTETVYGLGADARNSESVTGIFESKQRPSFDPLIVHVANTAAVESVVSEFPETAATLAKAFWPGPLTLVLPKRADISDLVTAGLQGVGVRVPNHPVALELLRLTDRPIAAPSANPFGGISPTSAQHVMNGLGGRLDGVLDGGSCTVGVESTVLSLMTDQPTILRPGGLPTEDIESVIGPVAKAKSDPTKDDAAQAAPGMLSRHYAPKTRLELVDNDQAAIPVTGRRCGLLTYGSGLQTAGFQQIERLCDSDDLRTCAINFFAAMRRLDEAQLDVIIARRFPANGLGIALNDRLQRAACS